MSSVMLYGFAKDNSGYKAVEKYTLYAHEVSISAIKYIADKFMSEHPQIVEVIAVDNRVGLKQEWLKAIQSNDLEVRYMFYDTVLRDGFRVASRN